MIGTKLSHYEVTAKLGEGGMGAVYRAEDTRLGREVAIKVLPPAFTADPERLARFEREARVLASLNHPNIAAIYGFEKADGQDFLVLELAEGETLQQRIAHGPIATEEALSIALGIAEALEAAHERGIVHRDLKPGNVVLAAGGGLSGATPSSQATVKVLDFGLAKALEGEPGQQTVDMTHSPTLTQQMTQAGVLLGTAAYMSPEQARGQVADRRADIWSFGVVLMEMLTGRGVYAGDTVSDTLAGVLAREPDWEALPEETPAPVRRLLERCLEKDVRERLQAIGEARIALERYLADPRAAEEALVAPEPGAAAPVWRRILPWAVAAGLGAVALSAFLLRAPAPAEAPRLRLDLQLADQPLLSDLGCSAVLSPDGRYLAYVIDQEEHHALYLKPLDQLEAMSIASGSVGPQGPYNPFFSPDGQWLGFVTSTEIRKVPVTGGTPITLGKVNRSRGADWASDGSIVFSPNPGSPLFTMPAAGGEARKLTELDTDAGEATHRWPQVLPNGKGVIFTSNNSEVGNFDQATIEVLDLESGERKVLQRGGYYGRYVPSGHLLFVNNGTIFAAPFDADRLELTGSPAPVVQHVASNPSDGGAQFSVSSDGMLAYASGQGILAAYPIAWIDRFGRSSPLLGVEATYGLPSLSPDATKLSFSVLKDQNWDVWVYDLTRGVSTRLTFEDGYDADQVWSPDGRYILYTSDRDGSDDLYRRRADGSGEPEQLTEGKSLYASDWSPDGRWITGVTSGKGNDLFLIDVEKGFEPEVFLSTPYSEWMASFSPDSHWIAYASNESGRYEIYVRPLPPATGRWQVSNDGGGEPRWSRDGKELFYRASDSVMAVPVEYGEDTFRAGTPRILFPSDFRGSPTGISVGNFIFRSYDVSPDGQRFVVFPQSKDAGRAGRIVLVTGWLDELQNLFPH